MPLLRSLLLQIALGMQHLHANGIIHGELRLDNVMVSGQLPSTMALLQQQQEQQRQEQQWQEQQRLSQQLEQSQHEGREDGQLQQQALQRYPPLEGGDGTQLLGVHTTSGVASSSVNHSFGGPNGSAALPSASSSATHGISSASSSGSSSGTVPRSSIDDFTVKLKDIGLCTIGWSHRQVSCTNLVLKNGADCWFDVECHQAAEERANNLVVGACFF
jgi:serine/threonine protein kinase